MEETTRKARAVTGNARPRRRVTPDVEPFDTPGASLCGITQKTAHTIIRHIKATETPARRRTKQNIRRVKAAVERQNGEAPTEDEIWRALKSRDIARNVRNFLWKGIHSGHKIGNYFTGMPAPWCEYAICPMCNTTEDLQHILFDCTSNEATNVWNLASDFMANRTDQWPPLDVGSVLGGPLLQFSNDGGQQRGLTRVMRIVITESAFLIWKIRCERRIEHEDDADAAPSVEEITGRWYAMINSRVAHDRHLTNKRRYRRKALDENLVLDTWDGLLELPENVPANWIRHPGVLVGRGTTRPRGRER
ncbi:hypothetical protein EXIGLDRAFT_613889 [Exidia glandulosa HHB12029]|uniref:Reverse transcriptase zinc-binding domain-containing protein n=1 Tax=Exidia glandulosa HHB12029 TaxID=1314781 RepID=A0A165I2H0_EXIGL|nr:hypothetical protein EXIGLDRAFT_613889 [Exidia glandulosa HHB12029]